MLQTPLGMCGRVELAVDAFDSPPLPVPGTFHDLPVAPAYVRWTVSRLNGGVVVPWRTAADFRSTLPSNGALQGRLCEGDVRERPRFGTQQYTSMPGRYLFLLAGNFDTTSLKNGVYVMTVYTADVRGNHATHRRAASPC